MYAALVAISYLREIPGFNARPIFLALTLLYFAVQLVYLFVVFDGSIAMRLLMFFLEKIIEVLGMSLGDAMAVWFIPDFMYHYVLDDTRGVWYFNASILTSEILIFAFCWVAVRLIRLVQNRNARLDILAFILIPASQFILFFISMVLYTRVISTAVYNPYGIAALVLGILGDLALFVMVRRMNENAELRARLDATKMQQSYYALLEEQQKQIREMQHDINNHAAVIRSLTANAPAGTDLQQYAEEITAPRLLNLHYCRNPILNALLVNKAADCRTAGIEAEFDIHLAAGTAGFDDYDLVTLISNLLDNAIEAAGAAAEKRLALSMRAAGGTLSLRCENTCGDAAGSYAANREKMSRGHGKAIIARTVKKYHGEMTVKPEAGRYTVDAMLFAREAA